MKKYATIAAERPIVLTRGYICQGIFAILFVIFSGCATAPHQPVTIRHEEMSPRSNAAMPDKQIRKEPPDQSIAALAALLKSRNIISAEEAASLTGQPVTVGAEEKERMEKVMTDTIGEINKDLREQSMSEDKKGSPGKVEKEGAAAAAPEWSERVRFGGDIRLRSKSDRLSKETAAIAQTDQPATIQQEKAPSGGEATSSDQQPTRGTAEQGIAALVDLLKNKNVISAEEASRLTAQLPSQPGGQGTAVNSETNEQERIEKITARAMEQVMANIQDQVKKQVREELAKEMKEHQKEQAEKITASVTEEIKKSLPEQVKSDVRGELPADLSKKETEKITATITQEMKKDFQEQVKAEVQQQIAEEMKVREKEQIDTIRASVTEEIKKSLPEQAKSGAREESPEEVSEKEQGEKIAASGAEDLKKDVEEQVKSQVKEELARELKEMGLVDSVAEWIKQRIRIEGDVRLRYQGDFFGKNNADLFNPADPTELLNTHNDQNRLKLRARVGLTAQITDELEAGVRISTGSTSNPVSENATLGNYESFESIILDLAYLRWKPVPSLTLWGGRMPNPFFFTPDFIWWRDLTFDGIALNYALALDKRLSIFANGLASPLQEFDLSSRDRWLFGAQLGLRHDPWPDLTYRIAAAFYDYINVTGEFNNPQQPDAEDFTAPPFQQKGNTLININAFMPPGTPILTGLAANFRLIDFTSDVEIGFWKPVYVTLSYDYVKNVGFNRQKVALRTGVNDKETEGYQVGLSVGHKQFLKFGDWQLFAFYKRLEADAVLDAFTDPDFHGGGTNAKGWVLGGSLALYKNIWLTVRWMTTDEISGPPLAIDTVQVDLNVKF